MLLCFGRICRPTRWLWLSCGLLSGADFLRGVVYQGGGWVPPGWWGTWSGSLPVPAVWLLALLYCSWALYPFLLVATGASVRTFALCASVIVLSAVIAVMWPVDPPWMSGSGRSIDAVPVLRDLVAGDVSPEAAFPSVHVAIPIVVAIAQRSWSWWACALITGLVVVLAGEHWVIDVLGGVCIAVLVVIAAATCGAMGRWCSARIVRRTSSLSCVRGRGGGYEMLCAGELVDHNGR